MADDVSVNSKDTTKSPKKHKEVAPAEKPRRRKKKENKQIVISLWVCIYDLFNYII